MYDNLTKDDIKKMQEEIEYRKLVVRKEALEAVKEARAQGDLSENFEYKAAKQDKNRNESRIRYLEKMIKTARIVSDESKSDEVGLGDRVELYIPEDDETESYKLVTTVRGNSMKGLISIDSPLGKAIKGRKTGDKVYIKVNDTYGYEAEIRSIDKTAKISYVLYPLIYPDVLCSCLVSVVLPENTIPYLLHFGNRQGIKKGRISINIFSLVIILL